MISYLLFINTSFVGDFIDNTEIKIVIKDYDSLFKLNTLKRILPIKKQLLLNVDKLIEFCKEIFGKIINDIMSMIDDQYDIFRTNLYHLDPLFFNYLIRNLRFDIIDAKKAIFDILVYNDYEVLELVKKLNKYFVENVLLITTNFEEEENLNAINVSKKNDQSCMINFETNIKYENINEMINSKILNKNLFVNNSKIEKTTKEKSLGYKCFDSNIQEKNILKHENLRTTSAEKDQNISKFFYILANKIYFTIRISDNLIYNKSYFLVYKELIKFTHNFIFNLLQNYKIFILAHIIHNNNLLLEKLKKNVFLKYKKGEEKTNRYMNFLYKSCLKKLDLIFEHLEEELTQYFFN